MAFLSVIWFFGKLSFVSLVERGTVTAAFPEHTLVGPN